MARFCEWVVLIAVSFGSLMFSAWVATVAWAWVAVPLFPGIPRRLDWSTALLILVFAGFLLPSNSTSEAKEDGPSAHWAPVLTGYIRPAIALGLAWAIHFFV